MMETQQPKTMRVRDFDYHLPQSLIAQAPIEPRDHARMLVVHRKENFVEHKHFYDLPQYLRPGDALARNISRVIPARLFGQRLTTGAKVEFMLLRRHNTTDWQALSKPAKRVVAGERFAFSPKLAATILACGADGLRELRFEYDGVFEELLDAVGSMPLPPYIHAPLQNRERYQTVYAKDPGSAAAPTAGLHFTPALLDQIATLPVAVVSMCLHVGLGTFRPVSVENIQDHHMHHEFYALDDASAQTLNRTRQSGGRIFGVGTTSCRILETCSNADGVFSAQCGETDIFIHPGYAFHGVDALITNFHLPQSTLLMLVSAMMGRQRALEIYQLAIDQGYRFFSFGDAMLIL